MIFKEENIMPPMLMEKLTEDEWVISSMIGIGYALLLWGVKPA